MNKTKNCGQMQFSLYPVLIVYSIITEELCSFLLTFNGQLFPTIVEAESRDPVTS